MNEVPFWVRYFKMLGSSQPWAGFTILPVSEQGLQWVQKNFSGTLPSMPIYFFQRFRAFNPDKKRQYWTLNTFRSGRRSCDFSLMRKATLYHHLRWSKGLSTVFCILLSGEIKEKKKQVRFNIKQNCKKINWWVQKQFQILSFQDGVKCTEVNFFLMT